MNILSFEYVKTYKYFHVTEFGWISNGGEVIKSKSRFIHVCKIMNLTSIFFNKFLRQRWGGDIDLLPKIPTASDSANRMHSFSEWQSFLKRDGLNNSSTEQ